MVFMTLPPAADPADDITQLLRQASAGDARAADEVVARLYADLRRIAVSRLRQSGDLTLDATALVHESYLRLQRAGGLDFPDRKHFLGYAARVMHTIVIDQVRARQAERRGGALQQVTFNTGIADLAPQRDDEVLRVHEALEELAAMDARLAQEVAPAVAEILREELGGDPQLPAFLALAPQYLRPEM